MERFALGQKLYTGADWTLIHVIAAQDEAEAQSRASNYRYYHELRKDECDLIPMPSYAENYEPADFWPLAGSLD